MTNRRSVLSFAFLLALNFIFSTSRADTNNLLVGFCTTNLAVAKAAGFDFTEARCREFARYSEAEFNAFAAASRASGIPQLTGFWLFPGDMKVVGTNVNWNAVTNYLETVFVRSKVLGIKILVFGSGDARRAPAGFPKEKSFEQLVALGKYMGAAAQKHGLMVVGEPLRRAEANTINSVAEGLQWVEAVDHPNFQLLADIYHMTEENEDSAIIVKAGAHIRHVHMANPKGRVLPMNAEEFDYTPFFKALNQIGYHGPMSIETRAVNLEKDGAASAQFVRAAYAAAGNAGK